VLIDGLGFIFGCAPKSVLAIDSNKHPPSLTVISFRTSLFYNSFPLTGQRISSVLSPSSSSLFLFVGNEEMCFYYSNVRRKKEKKKRVMSQSLTIFFKNPKLLALDDTADLLVNRFTINGTRYLAAIGYFCGFAGLFYCFVTAGILFQRVSIRVLILGG
jgi:hypothetical protein